MKYYIHNEATGYSQAASRTLWCSMDVKIVGWQTEASERAEKNRTIVYVEFIEEVRRSPSEANVADGLYHRHRDIERRKNAFAR